jgi:hypothetical protein
MDSRPAVGSLGRAVSKLAPSGRVEVLGATHPARTAANPIDAGRDILVTGFDPFGLLVREATPADLVPPPSPAPRTAQPSWAAVLLLTIGEGVSLIGCLASVLYGVASLVAGGHLWGGPDPIWNLIGLPLNLIGATVGFLYSAAMFVVFSRVKRLPAE